MDYSYGADKHGLVWGFRFDAEAPGEAFDGTQVEEWLAQQRAGQARGFLWLHFSLAHAASEGWLRRNLELPDSFYAALAEQGASTRLEVEEDQLVAALHDAAFDFDFDPHSVASVSLCLTPRLLVTARLRPVRSVDLLRGAARSGRGFRSPAELLATLFEFQASVLAGIGREAGNRIDHIEDALLANRVVTSRRELGALRRTLVRLQRLLAPEPAALFRLLSRAPAWMDAEDQQSLRQASEEFASTVADSSALVERVKLLQEELASMVGERSSRTLFLLTVVTVLALPVNLVAGLFGMNVGGVPLAQAPHGFAVVVGVLIVLTLAAGYLAWRNRGD